MKRTKAKRKISEARASKIVRELRKREICNIEYCDLKQKAELEELQELLRREAGR